jgi:hypothetical protein
LDFLVFFDVVEIGIFVMVVAGHENGDGDIALFVYDFGVNPGFGDGFGHTVNDHSFDGITYETFVCGAEFDVLSHYIAGGIGEDIDGIWFHESFGDTFAFHTFGDDLFEILFDVFADGGDGDGEFGRQHGTNVYAVNTFGGRGGAIGIPFCIVITLHLNIYM